MADQSEAEYQLPEPGLGDRKPEEELAGGGGGRGKGVVEGSVCVVELLVDELAADVLLVSQNTDGLPGQGVQGELLACRRWQRPCRSRRRKDNGHRRR